MSYLYDKIFSLPLDEVKVQNLLSHTTASVNVHVKVVIRKEFLDTNQVVLKSDNKTNPSNLIFLGC